MSKVKFTLLLFTLLFFAQNGLADEVLSWQECVELAAKNNNNLKSAIASERATNYQKNATVSAFLPQASANLISNRGNSGNSSNPSATTVQSSVVQAYNETFSVTQNVFNGFSDVGKFDQAKANNIISKVNILIAKAQISYDLKYAFANLNYAKATIKLLDRIIKRRQDNLDIINLRFKSGMENKGSLLLAQAYLEQARYDRLQGVNLVESARAQLCKAIGTSDCKAYNTDSSVPITANSTAKIDFNNVLERTPLHQQAVAQEQAAKAGILISRSSFMPTFNVTAATGHRGTTMLPQNDFWALNMNLSFAFFTGGKDYYTLRSAYATSTAAKENRENIDQQILVTLKQSYNSYIESIAKLKVDEDFRHAAELRADIARKKYNNGLLAFENWDGIENDLITREKNYLQSKLNRVAFEAAWEQAQGQGVFSND